MEIGTTLPSDSRRNEESRIVSNILRRLQDCLGEEHANFLRSSLSALGIGSLSGAGQLTMTQLDQVLQRIRAVVPGITLRLFTSLTTLDLGMVGYAAASAGTAGKALEILARYHDLTTDRFSEDLAVEGKSAILRPVPHLSYMAEYQDIAEDSLAGNWTVLRWLLSPEVDRSAASVHFAYPAPPHEDIYREVFGCPIEFEATYTELRFPAAWLELPVATANWAMADISSALCERILGAGSSKSGTPHDVQQLLLSRPGRHMLRLEEAAEQLRLSTAQLRKRLYNASTSYKQLVLEVRMALARHYLTATRLSVQEIAYLLDYSQSGPFSRAFKKYYGVTPQECREDSLSPGE